MYLCFRLNAQADTTRLENVVVQAFRQQVKWKESTASVAVVTQKTIAQFSPASLLPIMNTVAGVRMEERSPGSYRLAIRGNLLRSPFGVRNIKVYYNGLPQTDATGNSYLNLIDLQQVHQVELLKGPASSNYGIGTSGTVLIENGLQFADQPKRFWQAGLMVGSFGMQQQQALIISSATNSVNSLQVQHISAAGYRQQTALNRSGVQWQTKWRTKNNSIWQTLLWYTNLNYETPGGLTEAQMRDNPQQARPPVGVLPGAVVQKAGIKNETVQGALQLNKPISQQANMNAFIQLSYTAFTNPFITNYEVRKERNVNSGLSVDWKLSRTGNQLHWQNGFEYLINESGIENFLNNSGMKGALQSNDIVYSMQGFVFSQLHYNGTGKINLTAGVSSNVQQYTYKRLSMPASALNTRNITAPIVPRIALGYAITKNVQWYGIVSRGFSFPSLAEVRPSDGNFYPFLRPENGWNTEIGIKGIVWDRSILFDVNFYRFVLRDAIVRKTDAVGAEYFVNAGSLVQQGIEASIRYQKGVFTWQNSFSFQPYSFKNYSSGNTSFDGNRVTGVPRRIVYSGVSVNMQSGWYGNISVNATGRIPLNDANTFWANSYELVQLKFGKKAVFKKTIVHGYMGCDNLLNQLYSLGNDINAVGGRFFNPAPTRNIYVGLVFQSNNKQ